MRGAWAGGWRFIGEGVGIAFEGVLRAILEGVAWGVGHTVCDGDGEGECVGAWEKATAQCDGFEGVYSALLLSAVLKIY